MTSLYPPPAFVKSADHAALTGDPETLPANAYADATHRLYPCHTKAATWMSALFAYNQQDNSAKHKAVCQRIEKAAAYFNILPELEELKSRVEKVAGDETAALPDDMFAFVWEAADTKERHYPLRNAAEVKTAATWFGKHASAFRFDDKHTIAKKILAKAAEYATDIDNTDLLDRCGGFGYCDTETAATAWQKRASLVAGTNPAYAAQAKAVANSITTTGLTARDTGLRLKMAALMDEFDRLTGLTALYGGDLESPEDTLFMVTAKVASDFLSQHVATTNGAIYEKSQLEGLPIQHVQSWMGDDFADACGGVMLDVEKMAAILATLPRPDAEMFERMATAAGVSVVHREKAAESLGLSDAEITAAAAAYRSQHVTQPQA